MCELTAGIVSGVYIWNEPLQQATGLRPAPEGVVPVLDWKKSQELVEEDKDAAVKAAQPADIGKVASRAAEPSKPAAGTPATNTPPANAAPATPTPSAA